jgi:hypothetical protein
MKLVPYSEYPPSSATDEAIFDKLPVIVKNHSKCFQFQANFGGFSVLTTSLLPMSDKDIEVHRPITD